ncbi:MAG: ASCH domain-containing protein [Clostridiaceae bacterium]|nr:ASCH domain-containing protein [Clostridiaceae bacterium]
MDIDVFWQEFIKAEGLSPDTEYIEAFCFDEEDKDEHLLRLVLSGVKRATCSSLKYWQWLEEPLPISGEYSIVTDREGNPKCVFKTIDVHVLPFKDMTWEMCRREGEDESLESWINNHMNYFGKEAKMLRYEFSPDMTVVFEDFEVVYKACI